MSYPHYDNPLREIAPSMYRLLKNQCPIEVYVTFIQKFIDRVFTEDKICPEFINRVEKWSFILMFLMMFDIQLIYDKDHNMYINTGKAAFHVRYRGKTYYNYILTLKPYACIDFEELYMNDVSTQMMEESRLVNIPVLMSIAGISKPLADILLLSHRRYALICAKKYFGIISDGSEFNEDYWDDELSSDPDLMWDIDKSSETNSDE